ncbi:MAG TPA: helix-turn-helix domain-containing protein [Spirochaetota bacterium]|nr:helix-turn-helix domain-containing protein [Spirochaetota bacterium]HNT12252.1 helix-turn-helix domain-containing protein [Spirochaetota bacterium]HOS40584.1 helix-turn-helix domain-containing protein [Spirochaetota bacterium]HPU87936.1 helix-turn-helix domain-containing protein [Spirochaetota bacterium]
MISTGIKYLDKLLGGLSLGDNVVWQISNGVPIEYFLKSLIGASSEITNNIIYINFNYSPHTIFKRFEDAFRRLNITLVDAFTHGKGNGDPVFLDFYHQDDIDTTRVICVESPRDIPRFMEIMNEVQSGNQSGAFYIFDSLTGMNELWKDERAVLDFFTFTCPKLYDLNTIAYWVYEKDAHAREFIAGLTHITQVVLTVNNTSAGYYELRILKLEDRPSSHAGGAHFFSIVNRQVCFQDGRSENLYNIGRKVRELRKSAGITQAELAARMGLTPGAVSQIENDLITPSLQTLVQLTVIFSRPFEYFIDAAAAERGTGPVVSKKRLVKGAEGGALTVYALWDSGDIGIRPYVVSIAHEGVVDGPIMLYKGREFVTVISGVLNITVGGADRVLRKGDSIALGDDFAERWRNAGKGECEFYYVQF